MAGYGTDAGLADWLAGQGLALPDDAPAQAALRQRGSDYVDGTYGPRFVGQPAGGFVQERAWPRSAATLRTGETVPADVIPEAIVRAAYAAAYIEAADAGSLSGSGAMGAAVKREKVDVIEVEYQSAASWDIAFADQLAPVFSQIEGMVRPFLSHDLKADAKAPVGLWSIG